MTMSFRALAVLSALAVATPVLAHPAARALPRHARDFQAEFQALGPRLPPQDDAVRAVVGDEHDTATGGPVGGLADKN